jgi:hypothetical protein
MIRHRPPSRLQSQGHKPVFREFTRVLRVVAQTKLRTARRRKNRTAKS